MAAIELDLNKPDQLAEAKRLLSGKSLFVPMTNDPAPMGKHWCLVLPRHTTRLNTLINTRRAKIVYKKQDRELVAEWAGNAGIPGATRKRRVMLTVILAPKQRAADPDAYQKSLGDALVKCGLLVDDSRQWVEWMPAQFARGEGSKMFIELEDIL